MKKFIICSLLLLCCAAYAVETVIPVVQVPRLSVDFESQLRAIDRANGNKIQIEKGKTILFFSNIDETYALVVTIAWTPISAKRVNYNNIKITVPATKSRIISDLPKETFYDGYAHISYSSTTETISAYACALQAQ